MNDLSDLESLGDLGEPGDDLTSDPAGPVAPVAVFALPSAPVPFRALPARQAPPLLLAATSLDIEQVFARAAIGMALVTLDGQHLRVNKAYCDLIGATVDQVLAGDISEFVPVRDREMETARHQRVIAGNPSAGLKKRYERPDGSSVYGLMSSWLITDEAGIPMHVFTQVLDITERHYGAERLALMSERLEQAQRLAEVGSFTYDHATGQVEVSAQFCAVYGLPDVESFTLPNLIGSLPENVREPMSSLITGSDATDPEETRNTHQSYTDAAGIERTIISQARTLVDDDDRPLVSSGTSQDATALLRLQAQIETAASHDRLTGLPNRQCAVQQTAGLLRTSPRPGTPVAALYVDLDGFRIVNDSLGHQAGDDLLRQVADRLQTITRQATDDRPQDVLGRCVGDEFVLVCHGVGPDDAAVIASRIAAALAIPIRAGNRNVFVRASIGVAVAYDGVVPGMPQSDSAEEALIAAAEEALGTAKSRGGRGAVVHFAQSRRPQVLTRMTLEQDLWEAIDQGQISAVYQPIVDVRTGRVVQAEAFARWDHPQRGPVPPYEFIAVAAEAGLAPRIGAQILRTAVRELAKLTALGHRELRMSVNISAQQFADANLPGLIAAVLAENGLAGDRLVVEVEESPALVALDGLEQLRALRATGVKVAIDDFGSGGSSLSGVRGFPMDFVKIDRAFAGSVLTDPFNAEIVGAVGRLTHSLGGQVIGEGVETPEQLERLVSLGIDLAQGWHVSRPLDGHGLTGFLEQHRQR